MMRNTLAAFGGSMLLASFASAQVSEVVYFGDSLVDVGNVDTATIGLIPGGDYFDGRFSNGLLFSEYLATDLGVAVPTNSLAGGNNFAFGGAGASGNNFLGVIPSVENQVNFFLAGNTPTADALYLLWGGSNDIINGDDDVDNGVAAGAMVQSVANLAAAGARNIAVINLVPLGQTPRSRGTSDETRFDTQAAAFNDDLAAGLAGVRAADPGLELVEIDAFGAFGDILLDPNAFGLTNITDAAQDLGLGFDDADAFLFWDDIHPTTAGHRLLADEVFAALPDSITGIPEPSAIGLVAVGLLPRRRR